MFARRRHALQCGLISMLLSICYGCVTPAQSPSPPFSSELSAPTQFLAQGKLLVVQGERRSSLRFRWLQQDQFAIDLWGPLGTARHQLRGDETLMTISQGNAVLAAGTLEEIMQAHLGWSLPLQVVPFWLMGQPHQQASVRLVRRDADGRLVAFSQGSWQIMLSNFASLNDIELPKKISMQREGLAITIVLSSPLQTDVSD